MRKRLAWHRAGLFGLPGMKLSGDKMATRFAPLLEDLQPEGGASILGLSLLDLVSGITYPIRGKVTETYTFLGSDVTLSTNDSWQQIMAATKSGYEGVVVLVIATVTFSVNLSSTGGRALHVRVAQNATSGPSETGVGYAREWIYTNAGTRLVTLHAVMLDTYAFPGITYRVYVAADNVSGVTVKGTPSTSNLLPSQHAKTAMWIIELGLS